MEMAELNGVVEDEGDDVVAEGGVRAGCGVGAVTVAESGGEVVESLSPSTLML